MSSCIQCTSLPNSQHNDDCICNTENKCNFCPNCRWCIDNKKQGKCVPLNKYNSNNCINYIEYKKPEYHKDNHIGGNFNYTKFHQEKNKKNEFYTFMNLIIFVLMLLLLFISLHYKMN